jgi:hypothetical protein
MPLSGRQLIITLALTPAVKKGLLKGVRRGGNKELTVEGGIKASQVLIRVL